MGPVLYRSHITTCPRRQYRPRISTCLLVAMDPCYYRDTEQNVALGVTTDQDPNIVPAGTHQVLTSSFFSLSSSLQACFHCAAVLLFLLYFFTTYLLRLVSHGVSECLGLSQQWSQEYSALLMHCKDGQVSSPAWSAPLAYTVLDWYSFHDSSLSRLVW